ncbi:MAG: pyruvate carboxylase [Pseudomonadota bacterium]
MRPIQRLLVANRSEIAIRVFRGATELGIRTVAVYAREDRLSLHRFKADEAYEVGTGKGPIDAYLDIDDVLRIARAAEIDAIHPGYGFLAESPEFADACAAAGITFIGPSADAMRRLGNKVSARELAAAVGVPVIPATGPLPDDPATVARLAAEVGYPLMLKASWGGGGRGMRVVEDEAGLMEAVGSAKREAKAAFGKDEVYLEKLIRRARHVEVQLLGDAHGALVHLFERDCSIQRRNQKVIERAPAPYVDPPLRQRLGEAACAIGREVDYRGAGTVEFLMDADSGAFYFIEVNPRIQVEHTVTEEVTGIDVVKAQIRIAEGGRIGVPEETGIPVQASIRLDGHALQCRITTEDPENNFIPDYGRIIAYRGAMGFGIRVDGGTAYSGALVTRYYDALLEKVTAWAPTPDEVVDRMLRALTEYRIRGVATNLTFLEALLRHPTFRDSSYTTRFIDDTRELFDIAQPQDRATRLLSYVADVTVNGQPDVRDRPKPPPTVREPIAPTFDLDPLPGTRQRLDALGPRAFAAWMKAERRVLVTDTTMRDAHQSLLATRMRGYDLVEVADAYARGLPGLFSLECWGGATFDVAMRFLFEDPWERLVQVRERVPNVLTQMLLRGANGVGYTNYPDNVVRAFIAEAANAGMDVFRIFDCLNWVENMRVAIDAVGESGKLIEGAICYTGDILDPDRAKYSLRYYVDLAKELEAAGCHVLGLKDMAGLLKPAAARTLVTALKDAVDLPIHFHTHDTSGIAGASILAAVDAGVDAVDAAMDSMSGTTSQPCLGSIVEALRYTERETGLDPEAIRQVSFYWEAVRAQYRAFESDLLSGASEVYLHEMPGGQFTNLRAQARSMGLEERWHDVAARYREANDLCGDIVKVTPSSKVVGDLALMMVSQGLSAADVVDPDKDVALPGSVVEMLRGDLGQPPGGWPEALQRKALGDEAPITVRPGSLMPPADLQKARETAEGACGRKLSNQEFAAYLMYPKVFTDYAAINADYGPVFALPTRVFYYGMTPGEEIHVDIERGKRLIIQLTAVGTTHDDGRVEVFFEMNGQPRVVSVPNRGVQATRPAARKADPGNAAHVGAPMPGVVGAILVQQGQQVAAGDALMTLEAMKMETSLRAPHAGTVAEIAIEPHAQVDAKDLLIVLTPTA